MPHATGVRVVVPHHGNPTDLPCRRLAQQVSTSIGFIGDRIAQACFVARRLDAQSDRRTRADLPGDRLLPKKNSVWYVGLKCPARSIPVAASNSSYSRTTIRSEVRNVALCSRVGLWNCDSVRGLRYFGRTVLGLTTAVVEGGRLRWRERVLVPEPDIPNLAGEAHQFGGHTR